MVIHWQTDFPMGIPMVIQTVIPMVIQTGFHLLMVIMMDSQTETPKDSHSEILMVTRSVTRMVIQMTQIQHHTNTPGNRK